MENKLLVIVGSTALGKTDLALHLAKVFNGELIACDSRQVYKGLDIGTGKKPNQISIRQSSILRDSDPNGLADKKQRFNWEVGGVKIWMYDVANPKQQFTVKDYIKRASSVIDDISQKNKLPIIVGGTGLYLRGLLEGFEALSSPVDPKLREELETFSLGELQERVKVSVWERWEKMNDSDRKNKRRLVRVIELGSLSNVQRKHGLADKYQVLKVGIAAPREIVNERIDQRLISRVNQGLVEEGRRLHGVGLSYKRMKALGLEYGVLADLLAGKINQDQFIEQLKVKIHQYARRQITWFKKDKSIKWFDITKPGWRQKVEKLVKSWYYSNIKD